MKGAITGSKLLDYNGLTIEQCMEACQDHVNCVSINRHASDLCDLMDKTTASHPGSFFDFDHIIYMERSVAPVKGSSSKTRS